MVMMITAVMGTITIITKFYDTAAGNQRAVFLVQTKKHPPKGGCQK